MHSGHGRDWLRRDQILAKLAGLWFISLCPCRRSGTRPRRNYNRVESMVSCSNRRPTGAYADFRAEFDLARRTIRHILVRARLDVQTAPCSSVVTLSIPGCISINPLVLRLGLTIQTRSYNERGSYHIAALLSRALYLVQGRPSLSFDSSSGLLTYGSSITRRYTINWRRILEVLFRSNARTAPD